MAWALILRVISMAIEMAFLIVQHGIDQLMQATSFFFDATADIHLLLQIGFYLAGVGQHQLLQIINLGAQLIEIVPNSMLVKGRKSVITANAPCTREGKTGSRLCHAPNRNRASLGRREAWAFVRVRAGFDVF